LTIRSSNAGVRRKRRSRSLARANCPEIPRLTRQFSCPDTKSLWWDRGADRASRPGILNAVRRVRAHGKVAPGGLA
jgi:hypothetical protein